MPCYNYDGDEHQESKPQAQLPSSKPVNTAEEVQKQTTSDYPQPREEDRVVFAQRKPLDQTPVSHHTLKLSAEEQAAYTRAQRLSMFSLIAAAVSYFIGGIYLSILALICAIISYRNIKMHVDHESCCMRAEWEQLMRLTKVTLVLSGIGIILNAISTYMIITALQQGTYTSIFPWDLYGQTPSGSSSVWG